jgi:primosomal protein N' (replication factor Y)
MQVFDYLPPVGTDAGACARGSRVLVPFGRSRRVGVVVDIAAQSELADHQLKPVLAVLDPTPLLTAELMDAVVWTSRYYHHPLGEVLHAALPAGLRNPRAAEGAGERGLALKSSQASGEFKARVRARRNVLDLLARGPLRPPASTTCCRAGRACRQPEAARTDRAGPPGKQRIVAHADRRSGAQRRAAGAIDAIAARSDEFSPTLLEGITGSGKTEVYLALIERVIAEGRQALVLVPEIGLTPQALRRFRERLPGSVAVLHSGLSDGERTRAWLAAARGQVQVILGTRSAVFTPLPNAGLIVVDEEHDSSYKQHEGLRYNARDLAIVRAKALGVPIVLGTATPSLETLANVEADRYQRLHLGARAGAARLPAFHCIDLRGKTLHDGLAPELIAALRACLARGEQALIFRNRRGYAPVLHCHTCGWHATCARCDKPLTWHRGAARMRCHHCGADQRVPPQCPQCGNVHLAGPASAPSA